MTKMKPKEILVFDDEAPICALLQALLSRHGYKVRSSLDGARLEHLCDDQTPDLVITDIYMPNRDGLEVIIELRRSYPCVKILARSGRALPACLLPLAKKLGADLVLTKPFDVGRFLHSVESLLG